jgi:hypothetical protein
MFKSHVNRAISAGEDKGEFTRPKGEFCSLSFMITSSTCLSNKLLLWISSDAPCRCLGNCEAR